MPTFEAKTGIGFDPTIGAQNLDHAKFNIYYIPKALLPENQPRLAYAMINTPFGGSIFYVNGGSREHTILESLKRNRTIEATKIRTYRNGVMEYGLPYEYACYFNNVIANQFELTRNSAYEEERQAAFDTNLRENVQNFITKNKQEFFENLKLLLIHDYDSAYVLLKIIGINLEAATVEINKSKKHGPQKAVSGADLMQMFFAEGDNKNLQVIEEEPS